MKKVFLFVFLFSLSTVFAESKEFTLQMAAKIVYSKTNEEKFNFLECLTDKRCIDLEEIYEEN